MEATCPLGIDSLQVSEGVVGLLNLSPDKAMGMCYQGNGTPHSATQLSQDTCPHPFTPPSLVSRVHVVACSQATLRVDSRLLQEPEAPSKPWPSHLLGALAIAYSSWMEVLARGAAFAPWWVWGLQHFSLQELTPTSSRLACGLGWEMKAAPPTPSSASRPSLFTSPPLLCSTVRIIIF